MKRHPPPSQIVFLPDATGHPVAVAVSYQHGTLIEVWNFRSTDDDDDEPIVIEFRATAEPNYGQMVFNQHTSTLLVSNSLRGSIYCFHLSQRVPHAATHSLSDVDYYKAMEADQNLYIDSYFEIPLASNVIDFVDLSTATTEPSFFYTSPEGVTQVHLSEDLLKIYAPQISPASIDNTEVQAVSTQGPEPVASELVPEVNEAEEIAPSISLKDQIAVDVDVAVASDRESEPSSRTSTPLPKTSRTIRRNLRKSALAKASKAEVATTPAPFSDTASMVPEANGAESDVSSSAEPLSMPLPAPAVELSAIKSTLVEMEDNVYARISKLVTDQLAAQGSYCSVCRID